MNQIFVALVDFFSLDRRIFSIKDRVLFALVFIYSILSYLKFEFTINFVYFFFYILSPIDKISKFIEIKIDKIKTRTVFFAKFDQFDHAIEENKKMMTKIIEQEKLINEFQKYSEFEKIRNLSQININSFIYPIAILNNQEVIARFENDKKINLNDFILDSEYFLFGKVTGINNNLKLLRISTIRDQYINIPALTMKTNIHGMVNDGVDFSSSKCNAIFVPNDEKLKDEIQDNEILVSFSDENLTPNGISIGHLKKVDNLICIEKRTRPVNSNFFSINEKGLNYIIEYGFND